MSDPLINYSSQWLQKYGIGTEARTEIMAALRAARTDGMEAASKMADAKADALAEAALLAKTNRFDGTHKDLLYREREWREHADVIRGKAGEAGSREPKAPAAAESSGSASPVIIPECHKSVVMGHAEGIEAAFNAVRAYRDDMNANSPRPPDQVAYAVSVLDAALAKIAAAKEHSGEADSREQWAPAAAESSGSASPVPCFDHNKREAGSITPEDIEQSRFPRAGRG